MSESKKLNPFSFVNAINAGSRVDLMGDDPAAEKSYLPFIINRQMSYFHDTVLIANEVNRFSKVDNKLHYDFYRHMVRPKKRFAKWIKSVDDEDVNTVAEYYNMSKEKARGAMKCLTEDALKHMRSVLSRGGVSK